MVGRVLHEIEGDETVTWDASIIALPDIDENDVAFRPALVLYFSIPFGDNLNVAYTSPILPPFGLTTDLIKQVVKDSLAKLRAQIDQQSP